MPPDLWAETDALPWYQRWAANVLLVLLLVVVVFWSAVDRD